MKHKNISASIVLYNTDCIELKRTINSIFNENVDIKLFLIDNSQINNIQKFDNNIKIEYIHNPSNPGFGEAHNIAIKKAIESGIDYHFVVNPDIYFKGDVIFKMVDYMQSDNSIGMIMPQILNIDGSVQNLPKLLPYPFSILWRKIKKPAKAYRKFINRYELREIPEKQIYNAPVLSGCFTLLNLEAIKKVGMYDNRFFMYFEDWDLSRRVHQYYKTIYFPLVSVYHGYESGANKSGKLFKIFVNSAITYFNKWGWFFDSDRGEINKRALEQFK
ncbi:glycosyltransferase family 2 protein [Flavobacterium sp. KACC 22758]|jgi:GT2 family glycosyltransferase|uniref:glycosyltransferase n=1 Tax=Flavobacterium sp. KACC 22758 TaxID=3025667 RepID=UPI0023653244|nr:glycosyltransferase family 2 protein [Flavobacterium sp. KACC 22758]WDF59110.1 glycosyltransferase family 2 protein [Flavobacterium sp. KACC 22758]